MLATKVVRQGELAREKARGRRNGIVSRRRNDQPATLFEQLDLAPGLEPKLATELSGNQDLTL
jgi:hypothetical protein